MDFTTYSGLQTEVGRWMARSALTGSAAGFIQLAESRLNRKLPLRQMWTTVALVGVPSSRYIDLPTDYIEPEFLKLTTYGNEAAPLTIYTAQSLPYSNVVDQPRGWAIDGARIALNCPLDIAHTFDFRYRQKFALSDANPTNWLLTNHPDVYLAAVLVWAGAFIKNVQEASNWKGLLDEAIEELAWIESRGDALAPLEFDPALVTRTAFNINTGE